MNEGGASRSAGQANGHVDGLRYLHDPDTDVAPSYLEGMVIESVEYWHVDEFWPDDYRLDSALHEPDDAVVFRLKDSDDVIITWQTSGPDRHVTYWPDDFLRIVRMPAGEFEKRSWINVKRFDCSDVQPWNEMRGNSIMSIEPIDDTLEDGLLYSLGVKLSMSSGRMVEIIMGKWMDGSVGPSGDSLVVRFS